MVLLHSPLTGTSHKGYSWASQTFKDENKEVILNNEKMLMHIFGDTKGDQKILNHIRNSVTKLSTVTKFY